MSAPSKPTDYKRRILLVATGLTPQVVTETVYALIRQQPAFIPTEIHLVTTKEGAERARLSLLSADPGWFHRLRQDYQLPPIAFDSERIHVLQDAQGNPLDDIRSPQDNEAAADALTTLVRDLTADDQSALHVSLAGGRKTMGYYLGYALSLFGRSQDRLSHVLVSAPFESSWSFFYPTPYERIIETSDKKLVDCRDAEVTLAEIPFVRLRNGLPPRFLKGQARMSDVVAAANRMLQPPQLVLDVAQKRVWADDIEITLTPTEFALLLWLAERVKAGKPEVDRSAPEACDEFLEQAGRVMNKMSGDYERLEKSLLGDKEEKKSARKGDRVLTAKYFEPHKSRINKAFEESLGEQAAQRYAIENVGKRSDPHRSRYRLTLKDEQIIIRE
ncbi:MAG: CRISPR-associated ring nuclease Csm6 [Chloracidobacterium sp.]|nr:CRISPR-associated ring nuclease Csm6 [Chloracidobacterium sp.]MDW8216911.1 CRISPR-associated ring nuclease Csm6 [Acidobacteriota bacterium]